MDFMKSTHNFHDYIGTLRLLLTLVKKILFGLEKKDN